MRDCKSITILCRTPRASDSNAPKCAHFEPKIKKAVRKGVIFFSGTPDRRLERRVAPIYFGGGGADFRRYHGTDRRVFVRPYPLSGKGSAPESAQLFLSYLPAPFGCACLGLGQLSKGCGDLGGGCACALAVVACVKSRLLSALWINAGRCGRCAHHRPCDGGI